MEARNVGAGRMARIASGLAVRQFGFRLARQCCLGGEFLNGAIEGFWEEIA